MHDFPRTVLGKSFKFKCDSVAADGNAYAHYIFKALDKDQAGSLTFSDFVRGLAGLVRGSMQERLYWVFR